MEMKNTAVQKKRSGADLMLKFIQYLPAKLPYVVNLVERFDHFIRDFIRLNLQPPSADQYFQDAGIIIDIDFRSCDRCHNGERSV